MSSANTTFEIKIEIGSALPLDEEVSMVVNGRDQVSGLLSSIELTSEDVREAMREPLREIGDALKDILEITPPDLAGDIVENGIVLTKRHRPDRRRCLDKDARQISVRYGQTACICGRRAASCGS